jgi:tRNA 2-selenouridine synthase
MLKELQGKETVERWQAWARTGELSPLFAELMSLHYDPHYARSQARHFSAWPERARIDASDLSDSAIDGVADAVLALEFPRVQA